MKKLQDWDVRYRKFVQKNKNKPFVWGDWDCCRFVDGLVKEITGEHLIPETLDWTDEVTANKTIKDYGKTLYDGFNILSPTDDGINVASNDLAIKVWRIDG